MKSKLLLICISFIVGAGILGQVNAQNLLDGNNMESQSAWTLAPFNTADVISEWGYTDDKPLSGDAGALHIKINNVSGNSQFGAYQSVELTAGVTYTVDAAVKILGQVKQSWFEVYVGTVDPETVDDYSVSNETGIGIEEEGITKIVSYFSWWSSPTVPPSPNSTFLAGANAKSTFTPTATGTYYFLFKVGSNGGGHAEVLLDNILFGKDITPLPSLPKASFLTNKRVGFAPLAVTFTGTSVGATDYEWTLGDGTTKTGASVTHTYDEPGEYDITVKASNTVGDNTVESKKYIKVMAPASVTAGGLITGGNMEDEAQWQISTLNSPIDLGEATSLSSLEATWNYTGSATPTAGKNGALRVQITSHGSDVVQYCIYQQVTLDSEMIYAFDAAFRDNSENLWKAWTEVFISSVAPVDGEDFGSAATKIASLGNWDSNTGTTRGLDGTYQLNTTVSGYTPPASGDYYFVCKIGNMGNGIDAAEPASTLDIMIDELSLTQLEPKPFVSFSAENSSGFAPLTVTFKNHTQFGNSYEWDFGDGSPKSTEIEPVHTYTDVGDYTVSLKSVGAKGDSTLIKENFVSVVEKTPLPDGEKLYGGNMEKAGFWKTTPYGSANVPEVIWNYTGESFEGSDGGVLRVRNGNIAIYQEVEVRAGYVYMFDCDIKVSETTRQCWIQAFMWDAEPSQDNDEMSEDLHMGQLNTWVDGNVAGYEGKYSTKCVKGGAYPYDKCTYKASADGTVWFAIKMGNWEGANDILLDNLSIKEFVAPAEPDFIALDTSGDAPFEVAFFDLSDGAQSWLWDFGDGGTSTEQDPEHTYTQPGVYTVSLTVTNLDGLSATKTMEDYITVTGEAGVSHAIPEGYKIYTQAGSINILSDMPDMNISIYDMRGMLVEKHSHINQSFRSKTLNAGLYLVTINGSVVKLLVN